MSGPAHLGLLFLFFSRSPSYSRTSISVYLYCICIPTAVVSTKQHVQQALCGICICFISEVLVVGVFILSLALRLLFRFVLVLQLQKPIVPRRSPVFRRDSAAATSLYVTFFQTLFGSL